MDTLTYTATFAACGFALAAWNILMNMDRPFVSGVTDMVIRDNVDRITYLLALTFTYGLTGLVMPPMARLIFGAVPVIEAWARGIFA